MTLPTRILKEAMRSGGANITSQHIEDLSLCGLFLMEVARRIDSEFGVHRTSSHTTLDANEDITKLSNYLMEKKVVQKSEHRNSPMFADPTNVGLEKLCNSTWIRDTLERVETEDLEREDPVDNTITIDANYELSHVV